MTVIISFNKKSQSRAVLWLINSELSTGIRVPGAFQFFLVKSLLPSALLVRSLLVVVRWLLQLKTWFIDMTKLGDISYKCHLHHPSSKEKLSSEGPWKTSPSLSISRPHTCPQTNSRHLT